MNLVVVGQGPNRTAWEHGLEVGRNRALLRDGERTQENEIEAELFAENYCARVAITGSVGRKLAELAGFDLRKREELRFFASVARRNLNRRFNGKNGKGDAFDRAEALESARRILLEPFHRVVLLGEEVARAFGFKFSALEIRKLPNDPRRFLCFPHPSGINLWWNDDFNRFRAEKRLREFVDPTTSL